jgi:uncharacterized protein
MTTKRKFSFHDGKTGSALAVRVVPRSSKNELAGIMEDGTVKIRIKAAPVDGKANLMLIEFLSELLNVPKTKMEIVTGSTGKDKLVAVTGLSSAQLQEILAVQLKK